MIKTLLLSAVAAGTLLAGSPSLAAQTVSVELVRTFDYTVASGYTFDGTGQINDHGVFVLLVRKDLILAGALGFANGDFSQPFSGPNDSEFTLPIGINNSGLVCGGYDDGGITHGFFAIKSDFTTYDANPRNPISTIVEGVNGRNFVGNVQTGRVLSAFGVIDGVFVRILTTLQARASGINKLKEVVGSYAVYDGVETKYHGFLRAPDGTLTMPIDFPGALETTPRAINDSGYIAGYWNPGGSGFNHGFVIKLPDTFVSYDVPNAKVTVITGINNSGQICGYYQDQDFIGHGFIAQVVEQ